MQIKELLLGLPILLFVLWVFAAPLPQERITRTCEPVNWVGNLATSSTAISSESHTGTAARWSDKINYSCKYMVWRLIYQDDYNKAIASGQIVAPVSAGAAVKTVKDGTANKPAEKAAGAPGADLSKEKAQ